MMQQSILETKFTPPGANCTGSLIRPKSCSREFDFTLSFYQSILSILPSVLFIIITPARLLYLSKRHPKTVPHKYHTLKLFAAAINIILQLALVILWSSPAVFRTQTSVPSVVLSLVTSILILCLSYTEDRKSIRPSTLLTAYLLFSTLFDVTQVRTLWLTSPTNVASVQTASITVKVVMLLLETQSKTFYLQEPYKSYPPEARSGIVNLSFVWWLNSLFVKGFRKFMTTDDLFDIDHAMTSDVLGRKLQDVWERTGKRQGKYALPKAIAYYFRWNLLWAALPRFGIIGFSFAQPFLISSAIKFLELPVDEVNQKYSHGLIGATFLIYFGLAISTVHFKQQFTRICTIYNRTLGLQEGVFTESAALTLMSNDIDNIIEFLEKINDIWASSLEIIIGIWLLAHQLGATCVVPVVLTAVCVLGQRQVAKVIGRNQQRWNESIQKRVKTTSSMLGAVKPIKISGMVDSVAQNIQSERENELKVSRSFFWDIIWLNTLGDTPKIWAPVLSFIMFAIQAQIQGSDPLSTVQAFTSLSIITLVTNPALSLLVVIPQIASALGCFERIQIYLNSPSREDTRLVSQSNSSHSIHTRDNNNMIRLHSTTDAIVLENVTIFPATNANTAAITNASFTVPQGSLTIILGPVGSGKSTLIKAILGELPCNTGSVTVSSTRMSLCNQTSWLLNESIMKSICGPSNTEIDEEWYRAVIHACALDEDISQWPEGDLSVVGSKGLILSGGQKQRVALARAVYTRRDITLLDDVLSALDSKTQYSVSTRLLSNEGLLRKLGTTTVLITHTARCLHLADKIVVLDSTGAIAMQGTYEDIIKESRFVDNASTQDLKTVDQDITTIERSTAPRPTKAGDLVDETRRTGDSTTYLYYIKTIGFSSWAVFLVVQIGLAFCESFPQIWLNWWTQSGGRQLLLYLSIYAVLALASILLAGLSIWILMLVIMPRSAIELHRRLLSTVMNAPLSFFASTDTGVTLNRFSQDMSLVDMALPIALSGVASSIFACIAKVALISTGSSYMAITIPFTIVAIYAIQDVYLRTSRQLRLLDLENKSPIYSHFLETLEGLTTIRAFGWEHTSRETQAKLLDLSQKLYYMLICIQRWLNLVLDLIVTALAVIVVALAVSLRGTTSAGLLGIALNNVLSFNLSLSSLVTSWSGLETSLGAIARTKSFADQTENENLPGEHSEPPKKWPEEGRVVFERVKASYGDGTLALNGIDMAIEPGQKIGICGRTGRQSSLVMSILRFLNLSSGTITIDGFDLTTIPRNTVRQKLIAISQEPFILSGSVRSNADPLSTSTDAEIIAALTKIGIWIVLDTRGGLDATLEEQPLSQGEQQLFCLGRAVLRKGRRTGKGVLILDEATSSVDSVTDAIMQKVIKEEFDGWTVICVAHRLDTIMDADKIAVLDAGNLVEFDAPGNLLAKDSRFRRMYRS